MGTSHFNIMAVANALTRGKISHKKAEVVPGVVLDKVEKQETAIDKEFESLKVASKRSQNAILKQSCPPELKKLEGTVTAFAMKIEGSDTVFNIVATHGKVGISFPAEVVVRYLTPMNEECEVRFSTRPWVAHDKNWRILNIATFAEGEDFKTELFFETLKNSTGECTITTKNGYSVKNRGKNALEILTRSVYHRHIKLSKPKKAEEK